MQVLSSILLAILLLFGAFGPGARTCYAVRYVNKMEHSRMGLRAFEKRDVLVGGGYPGAPDHNTLHAQAAPPSPPPPGGLS